LFNFFMKRVPIASSISYIGEDVRISGFVSSVRLHGSVLFLDIRDSSGTVQAVITSQNGDYEKAKKVRPEWVVEVIGGIKERPENMKNKESKTGDIEMEIKELGIFSKAETPPFEISTKGYEVGEELRMRHRYIDLRRERLKRNLKKRHEVFLFCRNFLSNRNFLEVETPILTKSTPEGARDFLVPSRREKGSFYALPQSPQQYKQLLMVAGVEKYFQFARCFRDEDLRADRQAEFTQLDMELSFVEKEDVLSLVEQMVVELVEMLFPEKHIKEKPFPRITYGKAMEEWGSDRPDLRNNKEDENELAFAFITDFPMFEKNKEDNWTTLHHPFTMPSTKDPRRIRKNPDKLKSKQYDLVLNGNEIAGGSIRSHEKEVLEAVFSVLGYNKKETQERFGHLFEAFAYGVPPHGGIAFGMERFLMVLLNEENIREVIPFPKTGDGRDLMMGAPSEAVDEKQLRELGLKKNEE